MAGMVTKNLFSPVVAVTACTGLLGCWAEVASRGWFFAGGAPKVCVLLPDGSVGFSRVVVGSVV